MALTLLEAAKQMDGQSINRSIVEIFGQSTDLLRVLPFQNIPGNSHTYNREEALPGIGFRGVNEAFSEDAGIINPQTETLVIAGGDLDVDRFIVRTHGPNQRSQRVAMKVKNLGHQLTLKYVKGDSTTTQKEPDGLQVRVTGDQLIDAGSTSGGDALSLAKLDEAIDAVDNPTHLLMSQAMRRLLNTASRDTSVGGHINYEPNQFGRPVMTYQGIPILIADGNGDVNAALAFDEANPGGGSNVGTSIYVLSIGPMMLTGIQHESGVVVDDLGLIDEKPVFRTRVEWLPGLMIEHPRAVSRLRGIKNAAVVA